MNLYRHLREDIVSLLRVYKPEAEGLERVVCEPPRDRTHGDMACNAAMVLAKSWELSPRTLAEKLIKDLEIHPFIETAKIAGPGFINLKLKPSVWTQHLQYILENKQTYGFSDLGKNQKVNVESPSTNPTGPMHVGHCRIAVFGDVLANILEKTNHQVTREFYINDAGGQAQELARSLYSRYLEALGHQTSTPAAYQGSYLLPVAKALVAQDQDKWVGQPEDSWQKPLRTFAMKHMMTQIQSDLKNLGVECEVYTSEQTLHDSQAIEDTIRFLQNKELVYEGTLEAPKGKPVDDWEPRPQLLFKATLFGDDTDRPLKKSDGSWTYFAADIAYHRNKLERGFERLIDVLGADHVGYLKRISAAVKALTDNQAQVQVAVCKLVTFIDQGQIVKMSKRAGTFITVNEAIERVGRDALRFLMLNRNAETSIDFDFQKAIEQTKDNPVFYVQYAHARCASVLRHASSLFPNLKIPAPEIFSDEWDLKHIQVLADWPRQLEAAAVFCEPHRIAQFACEVASSFHALWTHGKENTELRFIFPDDLKKTQQRLALVQATSYVLQSAFKILGIEAPEEMRG